MKANEFVREFGISTAKDVLDNADVSKAACFAMITEPRIDYTELKRLVDSHELIRKLDFWGRIDKGLMKASMTIDNNTLHASYYQPDLGSYHRYGHNSIYIVKDNEWKEIYGGVDSNSLIHTDRLKQAIADVESCV